MSLSTSNERLRRGRVARTLALCGALLSVAGCAGLAPYRHPERVQQHWERQIARRGVDPAAVVNPLEYTDAMRSSAVELAGFGGPLERLRRLQRHLFNRESFPYDYESRKTLTAIEAFERRTGNCVSFTNLFISLARSVGLPVRAALVARPMAAEREGDLIIVNEHIVAVYEHTGGATVFDFNARSRQDPVRLTLIDDAWITAVYLNNRGVEALRAHDRAAAREQLEIAVLLAPRFAQALGNLGVVRRQQDDIAGALDAYRTALEIDAGHPTILGNLSALYLSQGRKAEARAALEAAKTRGASPFHLITRGDIERTAGRQRQALRFYRQAARLGQQLAEPFVAIARLEIERGRPAAARRALQRALERDAEDSRALALLRSLD